MNTQQYRRDAIYPRVAPRLTAVVKNQGIKNKGKSVSLPAIFKKLTAILKRHETNLRMEKRILGSLAKNKKPQLHLYGIQVTPRVGNRKYPEYIAGVIIQKAFVGFYCAPLASHPNQIKLPAVLKDLQQGKSCLHIKTDDVEILEALEKLLVKSIALYRKEKWI